MAASTTPLAPEHFDKALQELTRLAASSLAPDQFFQQFIQTAARVLGGIAGSVWGLNQDGLFLPIVEWNLEKTGIKRDSLSTKAHIQHHLHVLHTNLPMCCTVDGTGLSKAPCNATQLLVPLRCENNCLGTVELYLSAEIESEVANEALAGLELLSQKASHYLATQIHARQAGDDLKNTRSESLDGFVLKIHRSLELEQLAFTIVNEGRLLLKSERVSLVVKKGRKLHVVAVSGHDRIVHRSSLVRSMTKVATLIAQSEQPLEYAGHTRNLPPQVERPLLEYLQESGTRHLQGIPLFEPPPQGLEAGSKEPRAAVCAVLLVESFHETGTPVEPRTLQQVGQHAGLAVHHALTFQRGPSQALWTRLSKYLPRWAASGPGKLATILVFAILAVALLLLLPVNHRVEAEGILVPVIRQGVFAPQDGSVYEVLVQGGERVKQGQVLIRMRNEKMTMELLVVRNQMLEKQQLLSALQAESDGPDRNTNRDGAVRLRGQISKTQIEIEGLRQRLIDLEDSVAGLEIKAAISGTVASFQPQQQLLHRPVQRGEELLELMADQGPWKLELDLPAQRIGHVQTAAEAADSTHLPVYFVTATMPEERHLGYVQRIATRTTQAADQSAIVKLDVALDGNEVPNRTAGAEVFARISCGQRCLGYVLFGDVLDFVARRVW